jgi:thiosulfate dehydrogenase
MKTRRLSVLIIMVAAMTGGSGWAIGQIPGAGTATGAALPAAPFQPRPDNAIPPGKFGDAVRLGEQIFRETATYAPQFVGNQLRCSNCHLDAGRQAGASPMWAAYTAYPAYRSKNGHVNSYQERLQECFRYSMNGKEPKLGDPVLVALESYSYFLAKGLPVGEDVPGRGFPALPKPPLPADYGRGAQVYAESCVSCHGAKGAGQSQDGKVMFPALWGPQSFNWGAGMGSIKNAAEFIRANMPLGAGGSLSVQQAWDVATYVDSQVRPQDPRFTGNVAETRQKYHDTPFSMYGKTVDGTVLGDPASTSPAGSVPAEADIAPGSKD